MKKTPRENHDNFFQELTQPDYLRDMEIQDEYETTDETKTKGLSTEQVSQIAQDSLTDSSKYSGQTPLTMPFSSTDQATQ